MKRSFFSGCLLEYNKYLLRKRVGENKLCFLLFHALQAWFTPSFTVFRKSIGLHLLEGLLNGHNIEK